MKFVTLFLVLFQMFSAYFSYPITANNTNEIMLYLHKYGYMEKMDDHHKMHDALKDFQYFAGVVPTGEMDDATITMINHPRCGMPDKINSKERAKRYGYLAQKWNKKTLHYRIDKHTKQLPLPLVKKEIRRAAALWSDYSNVLIAETSDSNFADINIFFDNIDGKDRVLGLAYSPPNGTIQLDESEEWSIGCNEGVNLYQIIVHEMGHALGLAHSEIEEAAMFSMYLGYKSNFTLHFDDVVGIKSLYAEESKPLSYKHGIMNPLCIDSKIDAAFSSPDGYVYFIKKDFYWKLSSNFIILEGPKPIQHKWFELPEHVDSIVTQLNNETYFFKSKYYWKYNQNGEFEESRFIFKNYDKIPDGIDASLVWSGNGKTYFFKGSQYWAYDFQKPPNRRILSYYPKSISEWKGLPNNLDAALAVNGVSYFFKGTKYYKYNDNKERVKKGYPKDTAINLLGCEL